MDQGAKTFAIADHDGLLAVHGSYVPLVEPGPGVLLVDAGSEAVRATEQGQRSVDHVRQDVVGNFRIVLGETLLGQADVGPEHAIRMRQRHGHLRGFSRPHVRARRFHLPHDLVRTHVGTEGLERRMPQLVFGRPTAKGHLADEPGLYPAGVAARERRYRGLERRRRDA